MRSLIVSAVRFYGLIVFYPFRWYWEYRILSGSQAVDRFCGLIIVDWSYVEFLRDGPDYESFSGVRDCSSFRIRSTRYGSSLMIERSTLSGFFRAGFWRPFFGLLFFRNISPPLLLVLSSNRFDYALYRHIYIQSLVNNGSGNTRKGFKLCLKQVKAILDYRFCRVILEVVHFLISIRFWSL